MKDLWSRRMEVLFSINNDGSADSLTLKKRLGIEDKEFYPVVKSLINDGLLSRRKAFVENMYIKLAYFITDEGRKKVAKITPVQR